MRILFGVLFGVLALLLAGCSEASDVEPPTEKGELPAVTWDPVEWSGSGTVPVGNPTQCMELVDGREGVDLVRLTWTPEPPANVTAALKNMVFVLTESSASALDVNVFVYDATGRLIGESYNFNVGGGPGERVEVDGRQPFQTFTIDVWGCIGAAQSFDIKATAEVEDANNRSAD